MYLRRTPTLDDKLRAWPDNTPVLVIGGQEAGDGHLWERVRTPDGAEGFIPVEYLVGG